MRKAIRISPEFDELLEQVKQEHKPAKISDSQATALITRDYWKLKTTNNKTRGLL